MSKATLTALAKDLRGLVDRDDRDWPEETREFIADFAALLEKHAQ